MNSERQEMLESIIDGVFFLKGEEIVFVNKATCKMLNYTLAELTEISLKDLFPSKYYLNLFLNAIKEDEGIKYLELELLTKNGSLSSVNLSISPFFSKTHQPLYKLVIMRDVSEIEKARTTGINQFRLYAVKQLCCILTHMESGGRGPVILYNDKLPFTEVSGIEESSILLKLSIYYLTSVGQGSTYATGLFGPLPVFEYENFLAVVYPFFLKNPDNPDPRAKGMDYYILTIIFPKQLENLFTDRKSIKNDLFAFFKDIGNSKDLEANKKALLTIKNIVIFGRDPSTPTRERMLARKLSAITDLSTEINMMLELDTAYKYFTSFAERVLDFKIFALLLVNECDRSLRMVEHLGYNKDLSGFQIPLNSQRSVVSRCASTGNIQNIPDVREIEYYLDTDDDIRSELAVPIILDKRVIGVINIESIEESAFSTQDERIVIALASQIANYLARREYERKLRAIYEMQIVLTESSSLQQVYDKVNHFASTILKFPIFSVNILNKRQSTINLVSSTGYENPDVFKTLPLKGEKGIVRYVAVTGIEVLSQDITGDPRYSSTDNRVQSEFTIPIVVYNRVLGVLNAEKYQKNGFSKDDIGLLRALAKITGQFIIQKSLERQMTSLFQLTEQFVDTTSIRAVLDNVIMFIQKTFDYEFFSISFVDYERETVNLAASFGYSNVDHIKSISLMSPESIVVRTARERRFLNIVNVSKDKSFIPASSEKIVSEIAVPFFSVKDNLVLGVLNVESRFYQSFVDEDIIILERMGRIIAKAVERFPFIPTSFFIL